MNGGYSNLCGFYFCTNLPIAEAAYAQYCFFRIPSANLRSEPLIKSFGRQMPPCAATFAAYRLIRRARNTAGRNIFHQSSSALILVYAMPSVGGGYSIVTGASTTL